MIDKYITTLYDFYIIIIIAILLLSDIILTVLSIYDR